MGTTNSEMAVMEGGRPRVLENREGSRMTASVIAVTKTNERLVGQLAKRQAITNPENTVFSVKRLIGRRFDDPAVQDSIKTLPYKVSRGSDGGVRVAMGGKEYRPEEISAMVLQKLKMDAEEKLGETITEAVITVPAYFDDAQRQATKDAGKIAGLDVKRILNEPTAAALAYGFDKKKGQRVIVYDLGGGTLDVTILEIGEDILEVKATSGDTHLGGDDFDARIIEWLIAEFKKEYGIDLRKDHMALQRLKEAGEKAKIELSTSMETEINQPFITTDASGPKHLVMKFTRAKLEELTRDLADKTIEPCRLALKDAKLELKDIDEVILVGGQTRMPLIQRIVEQFFGKKPNFSVNPDEVVAVGAAIQAGIIQGEVKEVLLLDVTPLSLGIETLGGVFTKIIEKNTTVPTSKKQIFSTAADNQTSVEIHVLQGERDMANDDKTLARFILSGIPPAPRGVPQVEVSFDIDANGIVKVSATDKATGKMQQITITASTGLGKEEAEKMAAEAKKFEEDDKKKRQLVELRNQADTLIYTTEKTLNEFKDKVNESDRKAILDQADALKKIKDDPKADADSLKRAVEALNQAVMKIGEQLYKQGGSQPGAQS